MGQVGGQETMRGEEDVDKTAPSLVAGATTAGTRIGVKTDVPRRGREGGTSARSNALNGAS